MLEELKLKVLQAYKDLAKFGLCSLARGSVSAIDRESGLAVITPGGLTHDEMALKDMLVVDLVGNVIDGALHPADDMPAHVELYRAFDELGGVVHSNSTYATAFAQAGRDIPFYGVTHAETFYGDIQCTRDLTDDEFGDEYETNIAYAVVACIDGCNPLENPAVLVKSDGAFVFGATADEAVFNAVRLEEVARLAFLTELLDPETPRAADSYLDKHFSRKHPAIGRK